MLLLPPQVRDELARLEWQLSHRVSTTTVLREKRFIDARTVEQRAADANGFLEGRLTHKPFEHLAELLAATANAA